MKILLTLWLPLLVACGGEGNGKVVVLSDGSSNDTSISGTLVIQLEPKDGADPGTVDGAKLSVEGKPEISATADSDGVIEVTNILPGVLNVIVTSADGSGLVSAGTASFGLKLDDIVISAGEVNDLGLKQLQETGSIRAKVSFLVNNAVDLEGTLVYIPGTSFSAMTDSEGDFVLAGLPPGQYQVNFQRDGFAVTKIAGVLVNEGEQTDLGSIVMSLALGPEGALSVANGSPVTIGGKIVTLVKSRSVELIIKFDSDSVLMRLGKDPAFLNQNWEQVESSRMVDFDNDGAHSLYVMFADLNGLESAAYSVNFIIDTEAPVLTEIFILNGWSQTASSAVYISADVTDTGSGIAEIRFSNSSATLVGAVWQSYDTLNQWTLAAGDGAKTVYAQVRDFAGNVSEIAQDGIVKGDETIIYGTTYSQSITLTSVFSPYLIEANTTFAGDLVLEAGTVVRIEPTRTVKLKGRLLSKGTAIQPVSIVNAHDVPDFGCQEADLAFLDFTEAAPGVSEKSQIRYTNFEYLNFHLNGGEFRNTSFASPDCHSKYGEILKTGLDRLVLIDSHFENLKTVTIRNGNGLTILTQTTGDPGRIIQENSARNTRLEANNWTFKSGDFVDGKIDLTLGITFVGANTFIYDHASVGSPLFTYTGSASLEVTGIIVEDLNNSCSALIRDRGSFNLKISRSQIQCRKLFTRGPTNNPTGTIHFDRNMIEVSESLAELSSGGDIALSFTYNDLSLLGSVSQVARLFSLFYSPFGDADVSLSMNQNHVRCDTGNFCDGFLAAIYNGGFDIPVEQSITLDINIDQNFWEGLPMSVGLENRIVRDGFNNRNEAIVGSEYVIFEFDIGFNADPGADTDYIDNLFNVDPFENLVSAPVVGPSRP